MKIVKKLILVVLVTAVSAALMIGLVKLGFFLAKHERQAHTQEEAKDLSRETKGDLGEKEGKK